MNSNNLSHKRLLIRLILFSFLLSGSVIAQTYRGKVIDATARRPIPFANIAFGDGKTGIITDLNGRFTVSLSDLKNPIIISCIGYKKRTTDIISLLETSVIELQPLIIELKNIDVYPGKNPALVIMEKVVDGKNRHNPDLSTNYSCILYHKLSFKY